MVFIRSIGYALRGLRSAFVTERNFRIHILAFLITIVVGVYVGLSALEWGIILLAAGLVLAAELFNTALERLGDRVAQGKTDRAVGNSKDIAAAAVLTASAIALLIGIMILVIPLVRKLTAVFP